MIKTHIKLVLEAKIMESSYIHCGVASARLLPMLMS